MPGSARKERGARKSSTYDDTLMPRSPPVACAVGGRPDSNGHVNARVPTICGYGECGHAYLVWHDGGLCIGLVQRGNELGNQLIVSDTRRGAALTEAATELAASRRDGTASAELEVLRTAPLSPAMAARESASARRPASPPPIAPAREPDEGEQAQFTAPASRAARRSIGR
eukprot:scaffold64708_cov27-Tisochrysis_lutea.AAC.1